MTGGPETLEHLDVDPALRPLARALALRGPSWWVLVQLELRKAVDTRWGRWLLVAVVLVAVGGAVRGLTTAPAAVDLAHHVRSVFAAVVLVLPVVGVLATAGEWSRGAAVSFALVPQRGRVLAAAVAGALLLATATAATCALVALAAAAQAAQGKGVPLVLDGGGEALLVALAAAALATVAGAGLGAVTGSTAVGVGALGVMAAVHLVPDVLGGATPWLDAHAAFEQVAGGAVTSWPQTGTALAVWLVVPLVAGSVRWLRREVA